MKCSENKPIADFDHLINIYNQYRIYIILKLRLHTYTAHKYILLDYKLYTWYIQRMAMRTANGMRDLLVSQHHVKQITIGTQRISLGKWFEFFPILFPSSTYYNIILPLFWHLMTYQIGIVFGLCYRISLINDSCAFLPFSFDAGILSSQ